VRIPQSYARDFMSKPDVGKPDDLTILVAKIKRARITRA